MLEFLVPLFHGEKAQPSDVCSFLGERSLVIVAGVEDSRAGVGLVELQRRPLGVDFFLSGKTAVWVRDHIFFLVVGF